MSVLPRPHVVAALLAGRGAYRIATYVGGLALLARWGPAVFATYATAVGTVAWLMPLVSSGPEKAALNLVPLRGGTHLLGFFRSLALGAFAVCLLAGAVAGFVEGARPYAAAAVVAAGVGSVTVLVALYRLQGRPLADSLAFFGLAATYAVSVAAAFAGAAPLDVLLVQCAGTVAVTAALLVTPTLRPPHTSDAASRQDPGKIRDTAQILEGRSAGLSAGGRSAGQGGDRGRVAAWRAVAVLGTADVLGIAGVSTLYAAFAAADRPDETSLFYVLMVVSAVVSTGWGYLLRLAQPSVALRIERDGESAAWSAARRSLLWTLAVGVPAAVVVGVAGRSAGWAYAAIAVEIVLYAANAGSAMLLEASGARGRRWSASGSVVQLGAVAVIGWLLVPLAGATGGIAALIAGELARAVLLLTGTDLLNRRKRS